MSYTSISYLVFILLGAFIVYNIVPLKHRWKVLLAFSYLFYFINSGRYIIFILFGSLTIYVGGLLINKIDDGCSMARKALPKESKKEYKALIGWQKKCVCVCVVLVNVGILVFLKYSVFLGQVFTDVLGLIHINVENPMYQRMMPLGISFYTLSAVSYIVDVYRGKYRASDKFGKVALFLAFFPHIVEGPIARFDLVGEQMYEGHRFSYENMTMGLQLILWGFFKKIVIADRANMYVNQIFDNYASYTGLPIVVGMLLYTLQLYAEFSGCMDIVRGSAQTLGAWFKDYVFYSVSLSKPFVKLSKKTREHMNTFFATFVPMSIAMFIVWFGTGIWHGASWKYVMYGLYYWAIMVIGLLMEPLFKKLYGKMNVDRQGKVYRLLQVVRTFIFVNVGMLMFRADDLTAFGHMFVSMFRGFTFADLTNGTLLGMKLDMADFAVLAVGALILFLVGLCKEKGHQIRAELATKNIALRWAVYYVLLFGVIILGAYGKGYEVAGFIYAQF